MSKLTHEIELAANNNADLCATILTAHGLRFERDASTFYSVDPPPPYYPQLIALTPNTSGQQDAAIGNLQKADRPLSSIKDSFADLDPAALGMRVLFGASWIWRDGGQESMPEQWRKVGNAAELNAWHEAWCEAGSPTDQVIFPASALDDPNLVFLARGSGSPADSTVEAGCIVNLSDHVTGLSNVFAKTPSDATFAQAAQAATAVRPGVPVVGYEADDQLAWAQSAGFRTLGGLRILVPQG